MLALIKTLFFLEKKRKGELRGSFPNFSTVKRESKKLSNYERKVQKSP